MHSDEDYVQLLCLLSDIHRHLESGRTIHPSNKSVLNGDEDGRDAPTLTEYIGGVLAEQNAEARIKLYYAARPLKPR